VQVPCYDVGRMKPCLHQQAWRVLAAPPPPGGGLLLTCCCMCLLRLCMISGNLLRAAQLFCLAWSDFPTGGGAPGLPFDVLLHPCLHHIIVINSETAACMLISQHACTADHNIAPTCFALPQLYFTFLAYTNYSYTTFLIYLAALPFSPALLI
jgi:hypothetical protein